MAHGVTGESRGTRGRTAVWVRGAACAVALLLAQGASAADGGVAASTQRLFDAIQANDLAAAQASVAQGANLDARDRWGMTPIELAIDKGYFPIAHFLTSARNYRRQAPTPGGQAPAQTTATEGAPRSLAPPPVRTAPPGAGKKAAKSAAPGRPPSAATTPRA